MKKQSQSGFAIVELFVAVVILAAIAGSCYYVWHKEKKSNAPSTANSSLSPSYQSPSVNTPAAPQVSNTSDLNSAMQALNQTDVNSSNIDSSQLGSEASGF